MKQQLRWTWGADAGTHLFPATLAASIREHAHVFHTTTADVAGFAFHHIRLCNALLDRAPRQRWQLDDAAQRSKYHASAHADWNTGHAHDPTPDRMAIGVERPAIWMLAFADHRLLQDSTRINDRIQQALHWIINPETIPGQDPPWVAARLGSARFAARQKKEREEWTLGGPNASIMQRLRASLLAHFIIDSLEHEFVPLAEELNLAKARVLANQRALDALMKTHRI